MKNLQLPGRLKVKEEKSTENQLEKSNVDVRWSVAVATCFIAFFAVSTHSNLGFFYVSFLEAFRTDRRNAAWPGSIYEIVGHLAGILVAVMRKFCSVFQIGLVGSVILWMGLIAAVFAPDIPWMSATFGFIHGAGVGIVLISITVSIMTHFDKYRGLAAGLKYTGNSLSSLVLPKTLSMLRAAFSMRGTLLVYAGLCMNTSALMLFLRERPNKEDVALAKQLKQTRRRQNEQDKSDVQVELELSTHLVDGRRDSVSRRGSISTSRRRGSIAGAALADVGFTPCYDDSEQPAGDDCPTEPRKDGVAGGGTKSTGARKLLTSPSFYALVIGALTTDYTVTVVHGTIVDYALDKGVDRANAELSMTYCFPAILLGRLLLPLAADAGFISRTYLAALSLAFMACSALALPVTTTFLTYVFAQVCLAFFLACLGTLKAVLAADRFGAEAVPAYYGANGVALVPVLLANPLLTGYFRDVMGSYDNLFRMVAAIQMFTSSIYFVLAFKERRQRKKSDTLNKSPA
ncbi:monocarboxylate transporter 12-like [Haemaphysalis longicornis]